MKTYLCVNGEELDNPDVINNFEQPIKIKKFKRADFDRENNQKAYRLSVML
ncbi:MAG: hypothetical protein WC755_00040 [Candidatus Woesearchaeota archaeon]|jgi:hypothetical protein